MTAAQQRADQGCRWAGSRLVQPGRADHVTAVIDYDAAVLTTALLIL